MTQKFCDWCGEPALPDNELCHKCADAQQRVAAGQLMHHSPKKKEKTVLSVATTVVVFLAKGIAFMTLGWVMIVAGLFGTCTAIGAVSTAFSSLPTAFLFLLGSALGFGLAYLMFKLMWNMYPPKKIIDRSYTPPPVIENKPDSIDPDLE
ncbi:MAG: hypothetical protein K2X27_02680 [Candidatus Obscuribacterales bacterium]|nr:hypothetical protein [Candidatus Obscuribacterales bacterium]